MISICLFFELHFRVRRYLNLFLPIIFCVLNKILRNNVLTLFGRYLSSDYFSIVYIRSYEFLSEVNNKYLRGAEVNLSFIYARTGLLADILRVLEYQTGPALYQAADL